MDNAEAFIGQVEDLSKDTTISADERKDKMIAFVNARGVTGENALLKIEAIAFAASYYVMIELPPARLAAQRETGPLPFLEENMKKLHPKDRMLLDENREQLKKFAEQH